MFKNVTDKLTAKIDQIQNVYLHGSQLARTTLDRQLLLSGQIASQNVRQMARINTLADVEFRVTSQWGEDGIIEWLCHQLPGIDRSFVEFGVENYGEANTRFLLQNRGWRGLIMDGSVSHMAHVRSETLHWMFDLVAVDSFVTAENINNLIEENGFAGELGILSVDIDGNDYWVLKAVECVRPALLIAEFNGVFGDRHPITVPYKPDFDRLSAHHSGQYFGASIRAMVELAADKGFRFLGTNSNGVNAFFVRDDLAPPLLERIEEVKAWPPRHRDSRDEQGQLSFTRGQAKAELIADMQVEQVGKEQSGTARLGDLQPLYSDDWARDI